MPNGTPPPPHEGPAGGPGEVGWLRAPGLVPGGRGGVQKVERLYGRSTRNERGEKYEERGEDFPVIMHHHVHPTSSPTNHHHSTTTN